MGTIVMLTKSDALKLLANTSVKVWCRVVLITAILSLLVFLNPILLVGPIQKIQNSLAPEVSKIRK